jgi:hypothetical protein
MSRGQQSWEVWRQADGRWRWTWTGPEGHQLFSAHVFDSPEQAEESAKTAYPGVLGSVRGRTAKPVPVRVPAGRRARSMVAAAAVAATTALVLRRRRSRHR